VPTIRVQTTEEVARSFAPPGRRAVREEEMRPYREAVSQLGPETPGGVVELEENENPRLVMMRLHRAAHDKGLYLRFQRRGGNQRELRFRLQTPEETRRLKERGASLAQARQARRQPEPEPPKRTSRRRAS
jgi:hypothetical protein